jgi:hypothetical protein
VRRYILQSDYSPGLSKQLSRPLALALLLTRREKENLQRIAMGKSNKHIARELNLERFACRCAGDMSWFWVQGKAGGAQCGEPHKVSWEFKGGVNNFV